MFDDVKLRSEMLTVEGTTDETRRRATRTVTVLATRAVHRDRPAPRNPDATIRRLATETLAMLGLTETPAGSTAAHGTVLRARAGCSCARCSVHARSGAIPGRTP